MSSTSADAVPVWMRGPGPASLRRDLTAAARALTSAQQRALVRGDRDAADRLAHLERVIEHEAEYDDLVAHHDFPIVARRNDAPDGYTVGWLLRFDGAVRAARQVAGLPVDYRADDG